MLGHLGAKVLLPLLTVPPFAVDPPGVAAGIRPSAAVAARVEVEEVVGNVAQQRPVVADQGESSRAVAQPLGEERQG